MKKEIQPTIIKYCNMKKEEIQNIREYVLAVMADYCGYTLTEKDYFKAFYHYDTDFIDIIHSCEKEFNCYITYTGLDSDSFPDVKDFIDYIERQVKAHYQHPWPPYRYLITGNAQEFPAYTNWFEPDNDFADGIGMVVYDLYKGKYYDGEGWREIGEDHL